MSGGGITEWWSRVMGSGPAGLSTSSVASYGSINDTSSSTDDAASFLTASFASLPGDDDSGGTPGGGAGEMGGGASGDYGGPGGDPDVVELRSATSALHGPAPTIRPGETVKPPTSRSRARRMARKAGLAARWRAVPTKNNMTVLTAACTMNVACMISGMSFCFANIIITFTTPTVCAIVLYFVRKFGPKINRFIIVSTFILAVISSIAGVVGFSSGFWYGTEYGRSLEVWVDSVMPATYPFFIGYFILSMYVLIRLRREGAACVSAAYDKIMADAPPTKLYFKISGGRVEPTHYEQEASIMYFVNPDNTMQHYLVGELGIDPHTVSSCLDPNELARIESKTNHTGIVMKVPQLQRDQGSFFFKVESAGLFLFPERLVIIMHEIQPLFEGRLFSDVDTLVDVMLRLIYKSTYSFEDHLHLMNQCSEQLEVEIERFTDNNRLMQLFGLEKSMVFYLNALGTSARVLHHMLESDLRTKLEFSPSNIAMLDNMLIENEQCYKMAEIYSHIINGLIAARTSIIGNNLNVVVKVMNTLAISIAIPTFFAGMGGMSEYSTMVGFDNWPWAYPLFFVVMVILGVLVFIGVRSAEPLFR
ncbi:divalent metal ion transporter [Pelomyxa schiedti]|nr:divalent metal ion transporter [Pelomyxa schiedti]